MLATLSTDDNLVDKVQIVLNRVGSDTDITLKKAEETIGKPIYWQIPNEAKPLVESRNHGQPLLIHAPKCKVQQSIAGLAEAVCGRQLQPPVKEKASRWGALFSRR
jgi:pilus assembly protein CpaE